jgi:type I restriction enzyme S subunit
MATEWPLTVLGNLIDVKHGYAFKGEFIHDEPPGDILLTPGNFALGGGFQSNKKKYFVGQVPEDYLLSEKDLLVSMTDLSKESDTLGFPAFVPSAPDGVRFLHNQRLGKVIISATDKITIRFLYYLLCSREYRNEVLASATGTTVKHTSPERIRQFRFRLPPISTQKSISHVLGTLDDKIELNRQMATTLEKMARAIFKSWFIDFDPVIDNVITAGNPIPEPFQERAAHRQEVRAIAEAEGKTFGIQDDLGVMFASKFEESADGWFPLGFQPTTLEHYANLNPESWTKANHPKDIKYVDLANTKWGRIESLTRYPWDEAPSRAQRILRPGDTIVGTVRPGNGSFSLIDREGLTGSTGFAVLRPIRPENAAFVYLAATAKENIDRLTLLADGAAYPAVRPNVVAESPTFMVCDDLLSRFSEIVSPLLTRYSICTQQIERLAVLRDALLPKLISGELSVPEGLPALQEGAD